MKILRDKLLLALTVLIATVALTGVVGAVKQVGPAFSGFLVLENGVVPSVGLSIWPATADGEIYQTRVVRYDGIAFESADALRAYAAARPVGTPVEYVFESPAGNTTRVIESRRFEWSDFTLLYGLYLLNGTLLAAAAIFCCTRRARANGAAAAIPLMAIGAVWALSALDLYGPYRMFRLHALCECMLFAAALHMTLGYPTRARIADEFRWLIPSLYGAAGVLALSNQFGLMDPTIYTATHLLAVSAFGIGLLGLVVGEFHRMRSWTTLRPRLEVASIAAGGLVALSLPVVLSAMEMLTGGRSPQNAMALTAFVFPLSVAYAVTRDETSARTLPLQVR